MTGKENCCSLILQDIESFWYPHEDLRAGASNSVTGANLPRKLHTIQQLASTFVYEQSKEVLLLSGAFYIWRAAQRGHDMNYRSMSMYVYGITPLLILLRPSMY